MACRQILGGALKLLLVVLLTIAGFGYITHKSLEKVEALSAENQRLRLFNAREVRRFKRPDAVPRGTIEAQHVLGTPAVVIAAVWRQENGPPDVETGVLGKTDWISKNFPVDQWAALETGRTMNIYAWRWMMETEEGHKAYKKILKFAAKPYTGNTLPDVWAKNVYEFSQFTNSHR